jgi:spore germination protein GerM
MAVAVAAVVTLVAGCGEDGGDGFRAITPPPDLSESTTTTTTTAPSTTEATTLLPTTTVPTEVVSLYFVAGSQLRKTERIRPRGVSISDVVDLLTAGPVGDAGGAPLRSAIPASPRILTKASVTGGVATVDLAPAVRDLPRQDQLFVFGQVVLTLTERPNVGQVRFTLGGSPLAAFLPDGSQRDGAVTKEDYQTLLNGIATTVATTTAPPASPPATTAPPSTPPAAAPGAPPSTEAAP